MPDYMQSNRQKHISSPEQRKTLLSIESIQIRLIKNEALSVTSWSLLLDIMLLKITRIKSAESNITIMKKQKHSSFLPITRNSQQLLSLPYTRKDGRLSYSSDG